MLREILQEKLAADPFEPFVIKLVNGESHDIFYPGNVSVESNVVGIYPPDQNWAIIPFHAIASIECQFDDYQGKLAAHEKR